MVATGQSQARKLIIRSLLWQGLGKSHIFFVPKGKIWRLESYYATEKYADLPADDTNPYAYYPLGRLKWRIYDGICQMEGGKKSKSTILVGFFLNINHPHIYWTIFFLFYPFPPNILTSFHSKLWRIFQIHYNLAWKTFITLQRIGLRIAKDILL